MSPRRLLAALAITAALAGPAAGGAEAAPDELAARLDRAVALSWRGELPAALAAYREALQLAPGSRAARAGEARILGWQGHGDEAIARFRALLAEAPGDVEALIGLAGVYRALDQPGDARTYYLRVLAAHPDQPEAREGLRALAADRRIRITSAIEARRSGGADTLASRLGIHVAIPRRRWIAAEVTSNDPGVGPGTAPVAGWRTTVAAGAATPRLAGSLGYELAREDGLLTHGLTGELVRPLARGSIGAAARVRRTDGGALGALGSLGGERRAGERVVLGARLYLAAGSDAADDAVAAGTTLIWTPRRVELRLDLSESLRRAGTTTTGSARALVTVTRALAIAASTRVEHGAVDAVTGGAELHLLF